ncbi:hypothetical protein HYPSUDRAFT_209848 [Hypholoma sublateritium FD-334 SS-4]|uniref:Uncharacterized protein n=1 Tax=Hypholoma sublateritium (strain FD-334 SS-4) TaxID=945553 RepID=A0A0D2N8P6_HYPSF|nr:hypothetical protein HYPSUDRAFT_209848 [Hypholoma sublateritium FD-334 SS-4]
MAAIWGATWGYAPVLTWGARRGAPALAACRIAGGATSPPSAIADVARAGGRPGHARLRCVPQNLPLPSVADVARAGGGPGQRQWGELRRAACGGGSALTAPAAFVEAVLDDTRGHDGPQGGQRGATLLSAGADVPL